MTQSNIQGKVEFILFLKKSDWCTEKKNIVFGFSVEQEILRKSQVFHLSINFIKRNVWDSGGMKQN